MFSKKRKKFLFNKISGAVTKQLTELADAGHLTWGEIAQMSGVTANRISEMKCRGILSEETFKGFVVNGMIKLDKLLSENDLTDDEKSYLSRYGVVGIYEISKELDRLRKNGFNVNEPLNKFLEMLKEIK